MERFRSFPRRPRNRRMRGVDSLVLIVFALLVACASPPNLPPIGPYHAATLAAVRYRAVLIAGDASAPVFDNAVNSLANRLRESGGVVAADVQRLSAAPDKVAQKGALPASLDNVLRAIVAMRPDANQACLVFATSHGTHRGLRLSVTGETLTPAALDDALARGCGNAPTIVVVSGCFTGDFTQAPMTRANRVVLTASRADRSSFGCSARNRFTVYDGCLLAALNAGELWQRVNDSILKCVTAEERKRHYTASEPQAWFGPAVSAMTVPAGLGEAEGDAP